ncbi:tyrosine-protein phosphatase [Nocardioides sp. MH1]|uniref:tyrosine-protein phosphatase n=1 Tax=Nocardioides sp. MH1 TaxID=3242490 RepID=UPI0035222D43
MTANDEILRLASADNFRDVAGPGYRTTDGAKVRRGVLYRSNELQLTEADHGAVAGLGLVAICDLRTRPEIDRHPDAEIAGAAWLHFDVSGIPMDEVAGLRDRCSATDLMGRVYRGFVEVESSRAALGALFRQLARGGPQLFHCSAGKDRTGWAAALLLHLAGVDDATIEDDYLLTNDLTVESRARVEAEIAAALGAEHVAAFEPTLVVDPEYLRSAYAAVTTAYGDRATYLREGLGLDDATVAALRSMLRDEG